jgi:glycosyltransferase involved in cell wall biosynthesis
VFPTVNPPGKFRVFMTGDAVGGVWPYALDLSHGLAQAGALVTLAILGPAPSAEQRAEAHAIPGLRLLSTGLPLDWMSDGPEAVLAAGAVLADLARTYHADLVHLNSAAYAAGGQFASPLLIACHSCVATWWDAVRGPGLPEDFIWRRDLVAKGYRYADLLIAPSAAFARATARVYDLPQLPQVVYNGRARVVAAANGIRLPANFAFSAGRLWDEGKNLAAVDRAAARIAIPVLTAGSLTGPNRASVELPHLHNLGQLGSAAMAACYNAAAVFVSPAWYEPFGYAVLEAAHAGCALLLSDTPSFREIWGDAADYIPCDDDVGIARCIERLMNDPQLRQRRVDDVRRRAQRYRADIMATDTLNLYAGLLTHRSGMEAVF